MTSKSVHLAAGIALAFAGLVAHDARAVTVDGVNTGAIPDGPSPCHSATGAPRDVTFAVAGLSGNVIGVSLELTGTHPFLGDLRVILISPGGTQADIFNRTGATTPTAFGDSSNLGGPYVFDDFQTGNWWTAATAVDLNTAVPAGGYRSSAGGSATPTSLNPVFSGLTPAQANGTWTMRVTDGCQDDAGSITAATLTVNEMLADPIFRDGFETPQMQ